jgi:hypothetical protein
VVSGMFSRSQKQVSDLLDRFAESEPFAGPVVEFGGDLVQLGLGMHGEVAALGASVFVKQLAVPS